MLKNISISVIILFTSMISAHAGTGTGKVIEVAVQDCCGAPGPYAIFQTENRDAPSCTDSHDWFAVSLTTDLGKSSYALVLNAMQSGLPVTVLGTGNCTEIRNVFEDVSIIRAGLVQPGLN